MTSLALEELPFLNSIILESMRVHGFCVSLNERVLDGDGDMVLEEFIPEGVYCSVIIADLGYCDL